MFIKVLLIAKNDRQLKFSLKGKRTYWDIVKQQNTKNELSVPICDQVDEPRKRHDE